MLRNTSHSNQSARTKWFEVEIAGRGRQAIRPGREEQRLFWTWLIEPVDDSPEETENLGEIPKPEEKIGKEVLRER